MGEEDAAAFWESRYGEKERIWSGAPNEALVATVGGLAPGRALDLGCGEGGDSAWLAQRGWHVTALDVSPTALARAKALAATCGVPEDQITWVEADLATFVPDGEYELVSACFLHSPVEFPRAEVLRRAAGTLVAGGHLLLVAHAEPPPWATDGHHHRFFEPEGEIAELDLGPSFETVVAEVRLRRGNGPDGEEAILRDSVVLLRRR